MIRVKFKKVFKVRIIMKALFSNVLIFPDTQSFSHFLKWDFSPCSDIVQSIQLEM